MRSARLYKTFIIADLIQNRLIYGWMDERCFRPLLCTVKAELGRGQPGLMRWIWDETLPQSSIDHSTFYSATHRATKWASGRPTNLWSFPKYCINALCSTCTHKWTGTNVRMHYSESQHESQQISILNSQISIQRQRHITRLQHYTTFYVT